MKNLGRTKEITISAMLTALSIVYVRFMPTIDLGVWSFTPFSHIFIILGVFISPFVGIFTCLGTFFGFLLKGATPFVLMRAGSHIVFVFVMILLLKRMGSLDTKKIITLSIITALVHAVFEVIAVYLSIAIGIPVANQTIYYILAVVGGGTFIHSIIDFFAGFAVFKALKKSKVI